MVQPVPAAARLVITPPSADHPVPRFPARARGRQITLRFQLSR
jgi:hypothetical protein